MKAGTLDEMTDYAVEVLATGESTKIGALVREMASNWPNEPALSVSFAICSAAANLTDLMKNQQAVASTAYKLAALVAADTLAIEQTLESSAKTQHLLQYWRRVDPYFLEL